MRGMPGRSRCHRTAAPTGDKRLADRLSRPEARSNSARSGGNLALRIGVAIIANASRQDANAESFVHSRNPIDAAWPEAIHTQFRRVGIRQVGYVPDAGHSRLIELCRDDPDIVDVVLTTEEEGVGLVAGAALGGQRTALLMQSSGVGNCINMFALLRNCGFGCVVLVTMRGEFGEFNPWQVPMGTITEDVLRLAGFLTYRIDRADAVDDIVGAGCDMAFDGNLQIAILLSQRLIGRKQWTR
jgi:sulfopyruvate decarboxylase alpha subunit